MPTEMNDPVTQTATANITSGAGNLTNLRMEEMRQGGANRRQSEAIGAQERMAQLDQEFTREMTAGSQQFQGEQNALDREQQTTLAQEGMQLSREEQAASRAFEMKLRDADAKREGALLRYKAAMDEGRQDDAEGIHSELMAIDEDKEKQDSIFRRKTLAVQLATGKLQGQVGQIQQSSAQFGAGLLKLHNQIREATGAGITEAMIEGITTPAFGQFFKTSKFTDDKGISSATGNVGQQLVDSFLNGPAMSSIMELTETGDVSGASMATRNLLGSMIRASGAVKQGRAPKAFYDEMQGAVEQMRQFFDDHEIDSVVSSFADAFNSASTGFALSDLDTQIQGKKLKPTKEAANELRNVFNVFSGVGQFRTVLGLKSAEKTAREFEYTIPDVLNRLEELDPPLVEKILKGLPKEQQVEMRKQMMRAVELQQTITAETQGAEAAIAELERLGTHGAKVRGRIGKSNEKTRKAQADLQKRIESLYE